MVRLVVAVLLLIVVIGIPLMSVLRFESIRGHITVLDGLLHPSVVLTAVNLVDLVIVEWVIGVWSEPDFLAPPEVAPLRQQNTYRFH